MGYDVDLADRLREVLAGEPDLTESKMFGGLAFLLGGHMTVAASDEGRALVRLDPEEARRVVDAGTAVPMEMRGRPLRGWVLVGPDQLRTRRQIERWVGRATAFVRTLPPK